MQLPAEPSTGGVTLYSLLYVLGCEAAGGPFTGHCPAQELGFKVKNMLTHGSCLSPGTHASQGTVLCKCPLRLALTICALQPKAKRGAAQR